MRWKLNLAAVIKNHCPTEHKDKHLHTVQFKAFKISCQRHKAVVQPDKTGKLITYC